MKSSSFLIVGLVLVSGWSATVEGKCSRLPSGNCWVNCLTDIFDVICNDVTADMVRSDIRVFAGTKQQLRLYIWSSPSIVRLSADVFNSVASQILLLDLQDVSGLDTFPELYGLPNLLRVSIWNSPKLCTLSLELLPQSINRLAMNKVCISQFTNDFYEVPMLANMRQFVLRNVTIRAWQADFLTVFPNITLLEISNSTVNLAGGDAQDWIHIIPPMKLVTSLKLYNNRITSGVRDNSAEFLNGLVNAITVLPGALVDLSLNNLTLNERNIDRFRGLVLARTLNLRGNTLDASVAGVARMFEKYSNLEELNLGQANLIPAQGMFAPLPNLRVLKLDHNRLTDMTRVDIFDGFQATNLSYLDLSYNNLVLLPNKDTLQDLARQVTYLNLEGNSLQMFLANSSVHYKEQQEIVSAFSGLETLILSRNNFSVFNGFRLQNMTNLKVLDLSCNPIKRLSMSTFLGMPDSLREVDLSMCLDSTQDAPWIDEDAFTTMPKIKILRLGTGAYKKWIFSVLNFSSDTSQSLQELYLDGNDITYIRNGTIQGMPNLRVLSLNRNSLQSIAPDIFTNLPELRSLRVSENRITTITPETFTTNVRNQLQKLETLDLSANGIYKIYPGAFDELPQLRSLLLGQNPTDVQSIFVKGGKSLEYLGIQGYNGTCLKPEFFSQLSSLRWVLPDAYNLVLANPDQKLYTLDPQLQSLLQVCETGPDTPDHEIYPGLRDYVSVTIHDTDEGSGVQYPIIAAFLPLNYCPVDDYVTQLDNIICSKVKSMQKYR